jgi:hypothetical protein
LDYLKKTSDGKAECAECKSENKNKYIFEGSTASLRGHMTAHKESEYATKYLEMEKKVKEKRKQNRPNSPK